MAGPDVRYVDKRANEKFPINVTFLDDDEPSLVYSIASLTVSALDDQGVDVTSTIIDTSLNASSGNKATFWVRNGTAGKEYTVLVKVTMTSGEVFEQKIVLKVLK